MYSIKTIVNSFAFLSASIGFLSVFQYINPVFSITFIILFVTGVYFEKKRYFPVRRFILNIISVFVVLFSIFRLSTDNMVVPVVEALLILLGIKLIEKKEFRDYMQIFTISVFLLAGSALLSINIVFIFYFLTLFFLVSTGIIFLTFYSQDKELVLSKKQILSIFFKSIFIPLIAVPLTVVLFVILPRTDYPLFSFLNKSEKAVTGFSDKVSLGDVSQIQEDNSIALRIKMKKLNKPLYIRGIVLDYFDGKKWLKKDKTLLKNFKADSKNLVKYTVYLNPYGKNYLFTLNYPVKVFYDSKIYYDFTVESLKPINKTIKYRVYSINTDKIKQKLLNKSIYLQVPKVSKKVLNFARKLKKGKNNEEFIQFLKYYFNKNYKYTIEKLPYGKNALEEFLFVKRAGNCEFFASATALILRINNIPSRIVAGYKGADYNDLGGYYAVFNKNAHTWVEYYLNGYWHTLDTTPSISSDILNKKKVSFWFKLRLFIDTINYYYINFIIDFNTQKQIKMFRSVSGSIFSLKEGINKIINFIKNNIAYILTAILLTLIAFYLFNYYKRPYEERILEKFYKKLEKYGYKKAKNEGLREFISKIEDKELQKIANEFVILYEKYYFRDMEIDRDTRKKLESILNRL